MFIIEYYNKKVKKTYCYICECIWDKSQKKYIDHRRSIGYLSIDNKEFIPSKRFQDELYELYQLNEDERSDKSLMMIETLKEKYGFIYHPDNLVDLRVSHTKTAELIFNGPSLIFTPVTKKYQINKVLEKAFGTKDADAIISLAWYIASEGGALCNSESWFEYYDTPIDTPMCSQDVTRLLDRMNYDKICTFYSEWLGMFSNNQDKVLYDLTSISVYGEGIISKSWGYNRDNDNLPQVNYALLCLRKSGIPLYSWVMNGAISDINTLQLTLEQLSKLGYKPPCLMMDRGFSSIENITYMLQKKYTFFQSLKVNARWIYDIIDSTREERISPFAKHIYDGRTYYVSSTLCQWVILQKHNKTGTVEKHLVYQCKNKKGDKYVPKDDETILSQNSCYVHILFCQDLVGNHRDKLMDSVMEEYNRLVQEKDAEPKGKYKKFFIIDKPKYAKKRKVSIDNAALVHHDNQYSGHICFITNDRSIRSAITALEEYGTRDYIEKDFDEMKNVLDMKRIRVHKDDRMRARLLLQFIAEIYLREIRCTLGKNEIWKNATKNEIFNHIKTICKIKFKHRYKDVYLRLTKKQTSLIDALGAESHF